MTTSTKLKQNLPILLTFTLIVITFVSSSVLVTSCSNLVQKQRGVPRQSSHTLVAGFLKKSIDYSVKPGDDFYNYANGMWRKTYVMPEDKAIYGNFQGLIEQTQKDVKAVIEKTSSIRHPIGTNGQKITDLYNDFLNIDQRNRLGTISLIPHFNQIDTLSNKTQLAHYFAIANSAGFGTPFNYRVSGDAKDPTIYTLYLRQSGLGLGDRAYYLKADSKSVKIRTEYLKHLKKMLVLSGVKSSSQTASDILQFETKLARIQWKKEESRDSVKTYNVYNKSDLKKMMPDFDWDDFLSTFDAPNGQEVIIAQPSYFSALNRLILETELAIWKSYLKWQTLNTMSKYLDENLAEQNFSFNGTVLQGIPEPQPLWQQAVDILNTHLSDAVGQIYVAEHFKPETKEHVINLVHNLTNSYAISIKNLDWMGVETKAEALDKLQKITLKIGYPEKWKDYSSYTIKSGNLVNNIVQINKAAQKIDAGRLGKTVDRQEWGMYAQQVNAYYDPSMNEIGFPAAVLQPPFFNPLAEDAFNYGAIGSVIGHEIGHGFDDQGSTFDGDGVLRNWWTEKDKKAFKARTGKLIEQYNAFEVLEGLYVNGKFTLGENIGDLGGLSIAFKAYQLSLDGKPAPIIDGFTANQRFFIGNAQLFMSKERDGYLREQVARDSHSPTKFRTNGVVRNVPEFYETFDVNPGDKLYLAPKNRVKIW